MQVESLGKPRVVNKRFQRLDTHLVFFMHIDQLCNILSNTTMVILFTSHSKVIAAKITQSAVDKTQNL